MNVLFKGFDWKNGKFNEAQENYLKLFAKNQELIYLSGTTDEKIAEKHLFRVYKKVDKSKPKIIWYDSPEQMVKAVGASVGASVWDSVWDSVRDSVWDSVRDSVRASVWVS